METKTGFLSACERVYFCCKVGHFNTGVYGTDSLREPLVVVRGTAGFWHCHIDF